MDAARSAPDPWAAAGLAAWMVAAWLVAGSAAATTLEIVPNRPFYKFGSTIQLTILGDPEGVSDVGIFGRLTYSAIGTDTVRASQQLLTTSSGAGSWIGSTQLPVTDGAATVFNQIAPAVNPDVPSDTLTATVTLVAESTTGFIDFQWVADGSGNTLDFFGLTNAPGLRLFEVPEPSAGALLVLGLAALSASRRRRAC